MGGLLVLDDVAHCVSPELLLLAVQNALDWGSCADLIVASYVCLLVKAFWNVFAVACSIVGSILKDKYIGEFSGMNEDLGL